MHICNLAPLTLILAAFGCSETVEITMDLGFDDDGQGLLTPGSTVDELTIALATKESDDRWTFEWIDGRPLQLEVTSMASDPIELSSVNPACLFLRAGRYEDLFPEDRRELTDANNDSLFGRAILIDVGQAFPVTPVLYNRVRPPESTGSTSDFSLAERLTNREQLPTEGAITYNRFGNERVNLNCFVEARPVQLGDGLVLNILGSGEVTVRFPSQRTERCTSKTSPCFISDVSGGPYQLEVLQTEFNLLESLDGCSVQDQRTESGVVITTVSPGRCLVDVGPGWRAQFVFNRSNVEIRPLMPGVVPTSDPNLLRVLGPNIPRFSVDLVDSDGNDLPVESVAGDCTLLPSGAVEVSEASGFVANCDVTLGNQMGPPNRLSFEGRDGLVLEVTPGPAGSGQTVACTLAGSGSPECVDTQTSALVAYPLVYAAATPGVQIRANQSAQFSGDCTGSVDPQVGQVDVSGETLCQVDVMSEDRARLDLSFPVAGGTLQIDGMDACTFVQSTSQPDCTELAVPAQFNLTARPDGMFTEFVTFRRPTNLTGNEVGCPASASNPLALDLFQLAMEAGKNIPLQDLELRCEAEFAYTMNAELRSVDVALVGGSGDREVVSFPLQADLPSATPISKTETVSLNEVPSPFTVELSAEADGAIRLPQEYVTVQGRFGLTESSNPADAGTVRVDFEYRGTPIRLTVVLNAP